MPGLKRLRIARFRNIEAAEVSFSGKVTVFRGENAQGKTNILEAAHLVSNLHSFRTRRTGDMVMNGEKKAVIRAEVSDGPGTRSLGLDIEGSGKTVLLDGKAPSSAGEYLRVLKTVFFGPQDMDIARGNQLLRRRYLDRAVFSGDPSHLERLRNYSRVLRQRNEALRRDMRNLDVWTEQLASIGWEIGEARGKALDSLREAVCSVHRELSGGREELDLRMGGRKNAPADPGALLEALRRDEEEDRRRGFTRHGAHRERLEILLDGREISLHASQGQKRTMALSLKLALLGWIEEKSGDAPVFFLDDPGSELDARRLGCLGEFISGWNGQALIATVSLGDVPLSPSTERVSYTVRAGRVTAD